MGDELLKSLQLVLRLDARVAVSGSLAVRVRTGTELNGETSPRLDFIVHAYTLNWVHVLSVQVFVRLYLTFENGGGTCFVQIQA
jgi:hypothetical protein